MSSNDIEIGAVGWFDLTIPNADEVRGFYSKVTGWKHEGLSMGEYDDYVMKAPDTGRALAGVCHARGTNKDLPPQWIIYINVKNLDESIDNCNKLGGSVISEIKVMAGYGKYCIIKDPAGAVCALFEHT
jgi:predicted enzyme related to lactoylglutathione lyase